MTIRRALAAVGGQPSLRLPPLRSPRLTSPATCASSATTFPRLRPRPRPSPTTAHRTRSSSWATAGRVGPAGEQDRPLIDSMDPGAAAAFDDTEGIASIGDGQFVLAEERGPPARTASPTRRTRRSRARRCRAPSSARRSATRASKVSPTTRQTSGFVVVKEIEPAGHLPDDRRLGRGHGEQRLADHGELHQPLRSGRPEPARRRRRVSRTAGLGHLLILSQEAGKIVNVDRTGAVTSSLTTVGDRAAPDSRTRASTMDNDGTLYVVSEAGGGDVAIRSCGCTRRRRRRHQPGADRRSR